MKTARVVKRYDTKHPGKPWVARFYDLGILMPDQTVRFADWPAAYNYARRWFRRG